MPSLHTEELRPSEGHKGMRDGAGAVVGIGGKLFEALHLKVGEGISYFVLGPWDVVSSYQEIMFHGNEY